MTSYLVSEFVISNKSCIWQSLLQYAPSDADFYFFFVNPLFFRFSTEFDFGEELHSIRATLGKSHELKFVNYFNSCDLPKVARIEWSSSPKSNSVENLKNNGFIKKK